MTRLARLGRAALVVLGFAVVSAAYLDPAVRLALRGDGSALIGDGGDPTTVPVFYEELERAAHDHPKLLLYGSVYTDRISAPAGVGLWVPFVERILSLALAPFSSPVPRVALYTWALWILNAVAFYAFGRNEGWTRRLSFALALAFAITPYTRVRSQAHFSLTAIYFLPLTFLALRKLQAKRDGATIVLSALLFVVAVMTAQYYVFILIGIAPLLVWFYLRDLPAGDSRRAALRSLALAALPAAAFLAWNLAAPLPRDLLTAQSVNKPPPSFGFLKTFCAWPIDYLSSDLLHGGWDWNPARAAINRYVLTHFRGSNPIERSNGIRWVLLVPFIGLSLSLVRRESRERLSPGLRRAAVFGTALAAVGFLYSLSPILVEIGPLKFGPSRLLHALLPNFRVPSRFGPVAHFGVLLAVGAFLHHALAGRRERWLWALTPLVLLDFIPAGGVLMAPTKPALAELERAAPGRCGPGLFLPYVGPGPTEVRYYQGLQRLRGTSCASLHLNVESAADLLLVKRLGDGAFDDAAGSPANVMARARRFVDCTGARWIALRDTLPGAKKAELCSALGWERISNEACRAPAGTPAPPVRGAEACAGAVDDP